MAKKKSSVSSSVSVADMVNKVLSEAASMARLDWVAKLDQQKRELVEAVKEKVLAGESAASPTAKVLHSMIGGDAVVKRSTLEKWLRRS